MCPEQQVVQRLRFTIITTILKEGPMLSCVHSYKYFYFFLVHIFEEIPLFTQQPERRNSCILSCRHIQISFFNVWFWKTATMRATRTLIHSHRCEAHALISDLESPNLIFGVSTGLRRRPRPLQRKIRLCRILITLYPFPVHL